MPQDWETPKWVLPVTIPMLDDTLMVVDMIDSESSSIQLIESDYSITEELVMIPAPPEEGSISIDESYFTVPAIGDIFSEGSAPDIEVPSFDTDDFGVTDEISISIQSFISDEYSDLDCLPKDFLTEEISPDISPIETISIYSSDDFTGICDELMNSDPNFTTCEMSINDIIINNSLFSLTMDNGLPFSIVNFELEFLDQDSSPWDNGQGDVVGFVFEGVDPDDSEAQSIPLNGSVLPTEISANPTVTIDNQDEESDWETCELHVPLSEVETDIINTLTNEECILLGPGTDLFPGPGLVDEDCNLDIDGEDECLLLNDEVSDFTIVWYENQCQINLEGWLITGNESLDITYSFQMNDGELDAGIHMLYTNIGSADVAVEEGIELISAHLLNTVNDPDILNKNRLYLNYENDMFGDFGFDIHFDNFYDAQQQSLVIGPDELDGEGQYDFSDHYIGSPDNDNTEIIDNISYSIIASLDDPNVIIEMNREDPYGFSVESASITAFEFDQLKVNLEEFESPPIEMGDMPAGLSGMELPTLAFDLIFYNEINCPLTLNLDIIGVNEFETTTIHVEPNLDYYDYYEEIGLDTDGITEEECEEFRGRYDLESGACTYVDESTIRILEKSLDVIEIESINGGGITTTTTSYDYGLNSDGEQITIYDVFAADNIQVEGYASLSGICELEPGASVSADLELMIDPLTIVLTDDITFISETPSEIQPVASSENTIVQSAVLKLDIENHIPIDGRFDFLISNESQFPPCLDSLVSDLTLEEQVTNLRISQTCVEYINEYYPLLNSISVECEDLDDDCSDDYNFYYVEFDIGNDESVFFGKLADMALLLPSDIDDDGYVQTASTYSDSLNLLGDKLDWLSKDNLLYVTPQVILLKSDNDESNGYRTLRSTDYISFESLLRIEIDMGEVIE